MTVDLSKLDDTKTDPTDHNPLTTTDDKVPVFLCVFNLDRLDWAAQCVAAWRRMAECKLTVIVPTNLTPSAPLLIEKLGLEKGELAFISLTGPDFQRGRRVVAENLNDRPYYVVADDDCVPIGSSLLSRGIDILAEHEDFAILCPLPSNATINPWTDEERPDIVNTDMVMEHVDVGGIRLCAAGIMPMDIEEWLPPTSENRYDRDHATQIRALGYKVGYIKSQRFLHLGERVSAAEPTPEGETIIKIHEIGIQ